MLAFGSGLGGDYDKACSVAVCDDPAAAIAGLAHAHLSALWNQQPAMGPVSVVLRAPAAAFAQLGSDTTLEQYRWGAFICLLAAGLVVLWLARMAILRGAPWIAVAAFAVGLVVNPLSFRALALGHPEEPLAAALAVGSIVAAWSGRTRSAALMLAAA